MFIELTEVLDCPRCQAQLGLVAFVKELEERRVLEGHLGCPACREEFPIRSGAIDLSGSDDGTGRDTGTGDTPETAGAAGTGEAADTPDVGSEESARAAPGECSTERAMQVAALLGVQEHPGARLLLDEGLAACAADIVEWGERIEVLALQPRLESGGPEVPRVGVTPVAGAPDAIWPLRPHTLLGVALLRGSVDRLGEVERVLARGGRLVVLEPAAAVLDAISDHGFEILAAEPRALVAARR